MNSLLFCLLTLVNTHNDSLCREMFYDAAVKDTSSYSVFLKFEVTDASGKLKPIVLQNHRIFRARRASGESYAAYKKFIKELLREGRPLTAEEYRQYGGSELPTNHYVDRIAKKGKKRFIKHFFVNGVFNYRKYADHHLAVMEKMYDFGTLIAIVENGGFGIVYNSDCE
jgi:hypothetical protein